MKAYQNHHSNCSLFEHYRRLAYKKLPRHIFNFIDGGSYNELTINKNSSDLNQIQLHKKALRNVSNVDLSANVLGAHLPFPLILGPVGFSGLYARRGEVQAAKAAAAAGIPFCLSTVSICSVEEVKQSSSVPPWFQLYMIKDRGFCRALLQRASSAGCPVLFFSVDLPVVGVRYRDRRYGLGKGTHPASAHLARIWQYVSHPHWVLDVALCGQPFNLGNLTTVVPENLRRLTKIRRWVDSELDSSMTWSDLEWVRDNWPGKLVVKGILDREDALLAAKHGADGIVVSNHAGRHLDSTPSTISVLPRIVEAAGDKLDILFDGGITSGLDVIKALAYGAKACLMGRAWAFALAAKGELGVAELLNGMECELKNAMAHLGVAAIGQIDRNVIES